MKISVLVPVYGVEGWIERCARSLLGQSRAAAEFVFVDDASPDGSMAVLRRVVAEYPEREVRIITHERNRGLAAARQTAVQAATGDYVLHVDSDDSLALGALERLAGAVEATKADMVVFDYFEDYGGRQVRRKAFSAPLNDTTTQRHAFAMHEVPTDDYVRALLWRRATQNLWTKLIKRSLYDDFPFAPGLDYGEDLYAAPLLAARATRIVHLPEPLYYYNCANATAMSLTPTVAKAEQAVRVCQLLEQRLPARYADAAPGMKLHNKIALLQVAARPAWRYARRLYPEVSVRDVSRETSAFSVSLRLRERAVLLIARWRLWPLMTVYRTLARING